MEQNNESENVVDLSDVLNEGNNAVDSNTYNSNMPGELEEAKENTKRIPLLYRSIIKLSGGIIKNENQAKTVAVVVIIIANLITFSLVFKNNSGNVPEEALPAVSEMP